MDLDCWCSNCSVVVGEEMKFSWPWIIGGIVIFVFGMIITPGIPDFEILGLVVGLKGLGIDLFKIVGLKL